MTDKRQRIHVIRTITMNKRAPVRRHGTGNKGGYNYNDEQKGLLRDHRGQKREIIKRERQMNKVLGY